MDEKNELQEFDLDDIMNEFSDHPIVPAETPETAAAEAAEDVDVSIEALDHLLEELPEIPEVKVEEVSIDSIPLEPVDAPTAEEAEEEPVIIPGDTIRFEPVITEKAEAEEDAETTEDGVEASSTDETIRIELPEEKTGEEENEERFSTADLEAILADEAFQEMPEEEEAPLPPPPIVFQSPRARLRELKRKLVAGPEKRYYELSEIGVGRLQMAIIANLVIVALCVGVTTLYCLDMIPENRLRFVIFSQVLAMLVSALLGCHQIMDGFAELMKGRFSLNTLLGFTFLACCADAVFCLADLRVPCCAAFSLEVTMALLARYQRRTTEMSEMDTMRKANHLNSIVKEPDFFEGKPGILRGEGQVEDFMDTYNTLSGPEKVQNIYAFFAFLFCIGTAVVGGMFHGIDLALQILSTSMLVAVPSSFFLSLTRPKAILERRLHMVGTVLCGWQGVKNLCGKAAFPLSDEDLFPQGSTKLNGVKFYGDRNPDEVVSYTTALITAAGGGLVPVFQQLLNSRNGVEYSVENFQNYGSGGIGGEVNEEPVLVGTLNFLQDMGVEIPEGTMVSQAVYASIDGQLCAVYAISYAKMRSSAAGIVSLCGCRKVTPVLTGGDFMLTESMLRGKFSIRTRRIAFPAREVRQELAARQPDPASPALALTTREDLVSCAYAVTGARALRTASRLGVVIHLIGGILGMLIMLALAYLGTTELLTPTHVLLYQLVWMVPGLLVTEWTRTV